ncbi:MAG TPA: PD-(D/E)XK nuclease family protein [Pseudomonadales bacterium]|nr:PD-(D/E)XK nuclease family protein [Pseudomonadales bacterium]
MRSLTVSDWLDQIEHFPVVLVPNQRLIRVIQQKLKQLASQQVFKTPLIVTPWQWLHRCAEESLLSGKIAAHEWPQRILTKNQANVLWQDIIPNEFPRSVIAQAVSASQLCFEWGIQVDYPTAEFEHFSSWEQQFVSHCQARQWQDETRWHRSLLQWLIQGVFDLPEKLVWAEFDSLTPIIQAAQNSVETQGCEQFALSFGFEQPAAEIVVPCANAEQELFSAAHWCKKTLAKNSQAAIAVVIPDLTQRRVHVQSIFDKVLQPERLTSFELEAPRPFNISAAPKLTDYPIIKAALIILQCSQPQQIIEFDQLSELLRSPYFGDWNEFQARARLEAGIRRKITREFSLSEFIRAASRVNSEISSLLQKWQTQSDALNFTKQSYCDWANTFTQLLGSVNWPGSRGLSSHEYQVVQRFQQALGEFASLSAVAGTVSYGEALAWLQRILTDTAFQPKTEQEPRIQILGVLEALGQQFDAIWLCGLHDAAWPSAAKPHPLIPVAAQKKVNAPHSSAQRELDYARETLQHLKSHAREFVASYPQWLDDQALHPSRLLTGKEKSALIYDPQREFKAVSMQLVEDSQAPVVTPAELAGIRGGTSILEAQSICPLSAFIEFRLHATELETPERYVGSRERGSLLHGTLEQVWRELKDQARLLATSTAEREQLIMRSAEQVIQRNKMNLTTAQREIEINRLINYLQNWLNLECEREAFSIDQLEYELNETLAGLPLRVRIDRMDQIEPNIRLILDYKSSNKKDLKAWFADRITDVQLPLYACFLDADAISFALVTHKPSFKGLSNHAELFPGAETVEKYAGGNENLKTWSGLKEFWKSQLTALAGEFMRGEAANRFDKKDIEYSKVKPLLREAERVQQWLAAVDNKETSA